MSVVGEREVAGGRDQVRSGGGANTQLRPGAEDACDPGALRHPNDLLRSREPAGLGNVEDQHLAGAGLDQAGCFTDPSTALVGRNRDID